MKYTTEFILGLVGSILGLLFSVIWLFLGIEFWGGFVSGVLGEPDDFVSDSAYGLGFLINIVQVFLLLAIYIVGIIFSVPSIMAKNVKRSGILLLTGGIVALVINIASVIPSVLLIVAGSLCNGKSRKDPIETVVEQ
ncbi:hypothetical protein KO561_00650 [Radiobacillus kanasensis]|uniref:hypothetical protein n=1 Tax=Radiobacillus kanasensis TaxID=2844358 RepID=UPI001E31B31B|nr:hypothetical protein [Radiobacillus kanasensis]UFT99536.1 hypothetical protein KO561_00650 [Radiobacillus kanasensis]